MILESFESFNEKKEEIEEILKNSEMDKNYLDEPKKEYTEQDMLLAAKYGYNFHKTTSFPEQEFEESCVRNTQQWLTTIKK